MCGVSLENNDFLKPKAFDIAINQSQKEEADNTFQLWEATNVKKYGLNLDSIYILKQIHSFAIWTKLIHSIYFLSAVYTVTSHSKHTIPKVEKRLLV